MNQESFPQAPLEDDSSPGPFEEMAGNVGPYGQSFPIHPNFNEVSTISVQKPDPELASKMGENRQDLATSAVDANGHIQKPGSWLLLGYNQAGHEIEIGDYVSIEQFEEAIAKEVASNGDGAKIVRYNPPEKFPDVSSAVQDMFAAAIDGHSSIKLTPDDTMPNHNAHGTEIRDTDGESFKSSNILLKNEVQLPDGDYAHRPALDEAMGNYGITYGDNQDNQTNNEQ